MIIRRLAAILILACVCCAAGSGFASETQVSVVFSPDGPEWDGGDIAWDGETLTITGAGTYVLSGSCGHGRIVVDCGKKDNVTLILNGLSLEADHGRTLEIAGGREASIVLNEGTENRIASASEGEDAFSAVYSKGSLTVAGSGKLEVASAGKHGIQSADGIAVEDGDITVNAAGSGIRAHDSFLMEGGSLRIFSGGDGIRTTGDSTKPDRGWIEISGGYISVRSESDAVQAETTLLITGGVLDLQAGGGAETAPVREESWDRRRPGAEEEKTDEESRKGLKCGDTMTISGGEMTIDTMDDAVHSNNEVRIFGGSLNIRAGDDGIHADNRLEITAGEIRIDRSYEGMEANRIRISGGDISITADNDGLNAYGGENAWGGWPGPVRDNAPEEMPELIIEDGSLYINAEGDGLDSNGHLYVRGGRVIVDGPSRSMNGALDSGAENGGQMEISGGTILAIGSAGMSEVFDDSSAQCSFRYNGLSFSAGDTIRIGDAEGNILMEHRAAGSGNSIVFSAPSLAVGDRLLLTAGDQSLWIELDAVTTRIGNGGWGNRR